MTPQDLVAREVHYCVSQLISTLATSTGDHDSSAAGTDLATLAWQAMELAAPVDAWEEAAIQAGWFLARTEADRCMVFTHTDGRENRNTTWSELCEEQDLEPYQREIYEHWIVSDWLADKLEAHSEKVERNLAGLTVWARTTTGQAIYADDVIKAIAAETA